MKGSMLLALVGAAAAKKRCEADMRRLTLWMDLNCLFYGDYQNTEKQYLGQMVITELR